MIHFVKSFLKFAIPELYHEQKFVNVINFARFQKLLGVIHLAKKIFAAFILVLAFSICACASDSDKVLARVGSEDITESEILEFIQPFGQQAIMLYGTEQGRKMILDDVISMRLYALDAEDSKLDQTPEFQKQLLNAKRAMLAQAAMQTTAEGLTVDDNEAKKFYDDNPVMFRQPERIHARHILVSGDEELAKVQNDLKAGKSFDAVAKEYSRDPGSAANGGDLGEFPRGVMVPEFEKAAFALKNPGDVSEPVKTQFGWHIIKLEERIPESPVPFEQIKDRLKQELKEQKTQKALQDKAKELESKYKVERIADKPEQESPDKK